MNLIWVAFLTGLTTGGISCLAVQGGLLASSITSVEGEEAGSDRKWRHVAVFLVAKLVSHAILGYFLGLLGASLTLSPMVLGGVQIAVGLFMLATAARLLNLHPIFRYVVIQPPRWTYRLLRNQTKNASLFGPALLGFFTVLMPCGVTQATMAVALASGSAINGAAIMGAFVLGTSPIFFALGASLVEMMKRSVFSYVAAGVVIIFGIVSINGGLGLRGSVYTLQNIYTAMTSTPEELATGKTAVDVIDGTQNVMINVRSSGYTASAATLKANVPVRLTLTTDRVKGCARAFTIPELNISKILPETGNEIVEFTPKKTGRLAYTCSMGMYTGQFTVIN